MDFGLDVLDRVGRLHFEGDGLSRQGLHEDLHTTAQTKNQVQRRLLLDVVIRKSAAILELLSSENQTLLIGRNAYLKKKGGIPLNQIERE